MDPSRSRMDDPRSREYGGRPSRPRSPVTRSTTTARHHPRRRATVGSMSLPARTFTTTLLPRPRGGAVVRIPFAPSDDWRERDRWYVRGTIGGIGMRGTIDDRDGEPCLV